MEEFQYDDNELLAKTVSCLLESVSCDLFSWFSAVYFVFILV